MFNRKGQNIAEYSILIALVIGAAVAMQVYVKRGLQGRVADAVDYAPAASLGELGQINFTTKQYEPYYVESNAGVETGRALTETVGLGGATNRAGINETTSRTAGSYEKTTYNTETSR